MSPHFSHGCCKTLSPSQVRVGVATLAPWMGKGLIHRAHRRGYISGSTPKKIATCGSLILPFQGLKYINTTWSNQIRVYKFQHVTQKIDQFCKENTCWEAQFLPEVWNSTAYSREIVKHLLKMDEILEPPILESPRSYAHAWQIYIYKAFKIPAREIA